MLGYGSSNGHSNAYTFAEVDNDWDAFTSYSMACHTKHPTDPADGFQYLLTSKLTANQGWHVGLLGGSPNNTLRVTHDAGTADSANAAWNGGASVFTFMLVWNGSVLNFYKDNSLISSPAFSTAITNNATTLEIPGTGANGRLACDVGQAMIWRNYQLTAGERADYHGGNGELPPALGNLKFWVRGNVEPARDEQKGVTGTELGTVTLVSHVSDGYWLGGGGFSFLVAQVLGPLFMPWLMTHSHLFGPGSFRSSCADLAKLLDHRCVFDWRAAELRELMKSFEVRPVWVT